MHTYLSSCLLWECRIYIVDNWKATFVSSCEKNLNCGMLQHKISTKSLNFWKKTCKPLWENQNERKIQKVTKPEAKNEKIYRVLCLFMAQIYKILYRAIRNNTVNSISYWYSGLDQGRRNCRKFLLYNWRFCQARIFPFLNLKIKWPWSPQNFFKIHPFLIRLRKWQINSWWKRHFSSPSQLIPSQNHLTFQDTFLKSALTKQPNISQ